MNDMSTHAREDHARLLETAIALIHRQAGAIKRLEDRVTGLEAEMIVLKARAGSSEPVQQERVNEDQLAAMLRDVGDLMGSDVKSDDHKVEQRPQQRPISHAVDPLAIPTGQGRQTHSARGAEAAKAHALHARPANQGRVKTAKRKQQRLRKQIREAEEAGDDGARARYEEALAHVENRLAAVKDGFLVDIVTPPEEKSSGEGDGAH
jgi:hypothetical protein